MSTVTIAVDLAKHVFELGITTRLGVIQERKRLSRRQFEQFWSRRPPCRVVMEACASSHFWGRKLRSRGFEVILLPAHYVKPYRRRSKTDRADCEAILEAARSAGIHPVAIKSEDQQALLALHSVRSQWQHTRTARINVMRGLLHEFGVPAPSGSKRFLNELHRLVASKQECLPPRVRRTLIGLWEEVRALEERVETLECDSKRSRWSSPRSERYGRFPGSACSRPPRSSRASRIFTRSGAGVSCPVGWALHRASRPREDDVG